MELGARGGVARVMRGARGEGTLEKNPSDLDEGYERARVMRVGEGRRNP